MYPSISENKRQILMDIINQAENELMDLLHNVEEDKRVDDSTWKDIDERSNRLFRVITELREEVYYS